MPKSDLLRAIPFVLAAIVFGTILLATLLRQASRFFIGLMCLYAAVAFGVASWSAVIRSDMLAFVIGTTAAAACAGMAFLLHQLPAPAPKPKKQGTTTTSDGRSASNSSSLSLTPGAKPAGVTPGTVNGEAQQGGQRGPGQGPRSDRRPGGGNRPAQPAGAPGTGK